MSGVVEIYRTQEPIPCKAAAGQTITGGNVVTLSGAYQIAVCGAADKPLGVAQHDADGSDPDRDMVGVAVQGVWPLVASAAITAGAEVEAAANGRVAPFSSGNKVGRALTSASASGQVVEVLLTVA
jgi:hypothetical protein